MARTLLGLLVVGMFTLTGYYASATINQPELAPTADWTAKSSSCCQHKMRCCSDNDECTSACTKVGEESSCCQDKKEGCCKDKKD